MDDYKEQDDYPEIPIPSGDGWHKPADETAGAPQQNSGQPQNGWQQNANPYPQSGGPQPGNLYSQDAGQPQPNQQQNSSTPPSGSWICSCGTVNTGKFCSECGKPAPQNGGQQPNNWQQSGQSQNNWQQGGQQQNRQPQDNWQQSSPQQGPYQQNPYQQPPYQQAPPKETNPLALASMITGLLALVTCCCSPLIQFPLAVTSIVLMILSKRGMPLHGYAIAGLIMSIFAILLSILMTIMIGLVRSPQYQDFFNSPEFQDIFDEYESLYESFYGGEGEDLDSIYESIYDDYR